MFASFSRTATWKDLHGTALARTTVQICRHHPARSGRWAAARTSRENTKFYVDTDEANISRAEVFRLGKRGIFGQKRVMEGRVRLLEILREGCRCCRTVRLSYSNSILSKFALDSIEFCIHKILHSFSQPV